MAIPFWGAAATLQLGVSQMGYYAIALTHQACTARQTY